MADKITAPLIRSMKGRKKIVAVTAYDSTFASIADEAGVDVILVGDSVGNTMLGFQNTLPVTLEHMIHHTAACREVKHALLVADMPFGSYQASPEQAVLSALALVKAGAHAVKLEGVYSEAIRAIVKAGIPLMGHLGMTPQSIHQFGGFKVQGRGQAGCELIDAAKQLEDAGAFSIVLELIPAELAEDLTAQVGVPTIGIGAGPGCDGQVQVMHDLLGLSPSAYKHAKRYCEAREIVLRAFQDYAQEVRDSLFPGAENAF